MKTIILAGGYATRLWPITKEIAKPLLPLGRKKIIDMIVDKLLDIDLLDEIIVSTNRFYEDQFRKWFKERNLDENRVKIHVEETMREEHKLGSLGALYQIIRKIGTDNDYLVIAGDNIFSFDFRDFLNYYHAKKSTIIAVYDIKDKKKARRFGVVKVDKDDLITLFVEKPEDPPSSLISTGCYAFPKQQIKLLIEYIESKENPDSPGRFIEWLYKRERVYAFRFKGYWYDIGTPIAYIDAFKDLVHESYISENSEISNTKISHPIIVIDSVIENAHIGSHVFIGPSSKIIDSSISDTIVLEKVELQDVKLTKSIVGPNSVIRNISLKNSIIGSYTRIDGMINNG